MSRKGRKATPAIPSRTLIFNTLKGLALTAGYFGLNSPSAAKVTKAAALHSYGPCASLRGSLTPALLPGGPRCRAHPGPQRLTGIHARHLPPQVLRSAS